MSRVGKIGGCTVITGWMSAEKAEFWGKLNEVGEIVKQKKNKRKHVF